jgi:cyclopropane fatty-acyl-phospholipid synthase-like methyltransferase
MLAKPFVYFWEFVTSKERAKERAEYVLKPINQYYKKAKKILELGCGIGEVLVNLPEKYAVYGLDIEKDYVEVCKKKIPRGKFFVASMHDFKIDEKFDVIFCVGDAINYLRKFAQWKSTFKSVNNHLKGDGLFILEMETPRILKDNNPHTSGKRATSSVKEFSKGYYLQYQCHKGNKLTWDVRIFERLPNGLYQLNKYEFDETIYPVARVKQALSNHFEILETNPMEKGRIVVFACRKK